MQPTKHSDEITTNSTASTASTAKAVNPPTERIEQLAKQPVKRAARRTTKRVAAERDYYGAKVIVYVVISVILTLISVSALVMWLLV